MQIKFGMYFDGRRWSTGKSAVLGEITAGPLQFAALLEEFTCLDGIRKTVPHRINEYREEIAALDPPWCRKSFSSDPWSTAKKLLEWRNETGRKPLPHWKILNTQATFSPTVCSISSMRLTEYHSPIL